MANFVVVTSESDRLLFEYNDYAPYFALNEPDPKPQAILRACYPKSDFGNIELFTNADGYTLVRAEHKDRGGNYQVCNNGDYDLVSSLAAGVIIIESINGTPMDSDNLALHAAICTALG